MQSLMPPCSFTVPLSLVFFLIALAQTVALVFVDRQKKARKREEFEGERESVSWAG